MSGKHWTRSLQRQEERGRSSYWVTASAKESAVPEGVSTTTGPILVPEATELAVNQLAGIRTVMVCGLVPVTTVT